MIRKLLLLLVVINSYLQTTLAQGAELYANCFWQSANNRIVLRLAISNPTGSNTGQMKFVGMRFGFQYNAAEVLYAGYSSYMHNSYNTGLNDGAFLNFIGEDTGPNAAGIDTALFPTGIRIAAITTGGSKTMQVRYINRSTSVCENAIPINAGETKILLDIYFTLNTKPPAYYHLNNTNYGFGDTEFIAQFLTKFNGAHTGNLTDGYKEIAVVAIRQSNSSNPYQPFDASSCTNSNFNPITIGSDDINFITPINGVLAGKAVEATVADKSTHVFLQWKSKNNELIDYFEIERRDNNGDFKTIGLVMSTDKQTEENYEYKDKITIRDIESHYRVKAVGLDKITTYSDVQKIRLGSEQALQIKVYPNPIGDAVSMKLPEQSGLYVCRMYGAGGQMLLSANVSASNNSINVSCIPAGAYFMELYEPKTGKKYYTQFLKK